MQPSGNLTRDNHYVQQALTRRWSDDGNNVYAYRTLVSHPSVNEWQVKSIKGLGEQRDLYTVFQGGRESDEFEHWIQKQFEDAGIAATEKVISGTRLTPADWHAALRYVAAQDLRTPLTFIEAVQRWGQELAPAHLTKFLKEAVEEILVLRVEGALPAPSPLSDAYAGSIKVKIDRPKDPVVGLAAVQLSVKIGRRLWIQNMRQLLIDNAAVICEQRWSIVEPYGDEEWPLTDQPVVRLNYYKPGNYDFGGGWGNKNSEIIMPISPRHLLYVKLGSKLPNRFAASLDITRHLQRFLVERAYRHVFASNLLPWVKEVRPVR